MAISYIFTGAQITASSAWDAYIFTQSFDYSPVVGGGFEATGFNHSQTVYFYGSQETNGAHGLRVSATDDGVGMQDGRGNHTISVQSGASVIAYNSNAIQGWGYDNQFINHGYLSGTYGIVQYGGNSHISNHGTIEAQYTGIFATGSVAFPTVEILNTGTISATTNGVYVLGTGRIDNTGNIYASENAALTSVVTADGTVTISNSGTIASPKHALEFIGSDSTHGIVNNSGTMMGGVEFQSTSGTIFNSGVISGALNTLNYADKVFNHGEVASNVDLGTHTDVYRGSGIVTGTIDGGSGDDRFYVKGDVGAVDGGDDTDVLYTTVSIDDVSNVEKIILRGDNQSHIDLTVTGTTGAYVRGTGGENEITGGEGDDDLRGLGGADTLNGGLGGDDLYGGGAADVFVFDDAAGLSHLKGKTDWIMDFAGADMIDLTGMGAFTFLGGGGFTGTGGAELRYRNAGGNGEIQLDVDGDGARDVVIMVDGVTSFNAGDFIL